MLPIITISSVFTQEEMEDLKKERSKLIPNIKDNMRARCDHDNGKIRTVIQYDKSIPTNKKQTWVCIKCNAIIESAMEDGGKYIDTPLFK